MPSDDQIFPKNKITLLQNHLPDFDVDALLLLDMKNIRYLTGFSGSDGALLISRQEAYLMVDGRYTTQAKRETHGLVVSEYRDKVSGITTILQDKQTESIGFESQAMTVDFYFKIQEQLNRVSLIPLTDQLDSLRIIKTDEEILRIRKAIDISADALQTLEQILKPGICEMDIALELEYKMRSNGAGQVSFPTIAASGPNSALPHAQPGTRRLEDGDVLVIDYGAVYDGYHSDETWTCIIGHADDKQREIYNLVKEAHDRAIDKLKNGVIAMDIDLTARACIEKGGFGHFFSHGTGHGVGLDVHEAPRISAQSDTVLKTGMIVTIEPGIYIPDLWGMRIEDMALIKEDSCEILTKTSKDFKIL